jgi:hypothetical protein
VDLNCETCLRLSGEYSKAVKNPFGVQALEAILREIKAHDAAYANRASADDDQKELLG